jgi:hypothetical protein
MGARRMAQPNSTLDAKAASAPFDRSARARSWLLQIGRRPSLGVRSIIRRSRAAWRALWLFRAAAAVFLLATAALLIRTVGQELLPDTAQLWDAGNLDATLKSALSAVILLCTLALLSLVFFPRSKLFRELRREGFKWVSFAGVLLTLFAAYSAFRNQSMLTSEAALSSAGYDLYRLEMSRSEIRCLYFNYGHFNPRDCLSRMASSPDRWSFALFYVEETWFQLSQAPAEGAAWGSNYAETIKYWAQDVSRDPTGMFAYYLVSSSNSLDGARETMHAARVNIPNLCTRYRIVWHALRRFGAQPPLVSGAGRECGLYEPTDLTILAAGHLPIEEE